MAVGALVCRRLIESGKKDLKKEACWIVSNITAGSAMQIDAVCASGLVPSLIRASAPAKLWTSCHRLR
jgi:importin subunit alpha-1